MKIIAANKKANHDYSINAQLFLSHCQWLLTQGLDGLGVFGTTGEANAFNIEENTAHDDVDLDKIRETIESL